MQATADNSHGQDARATRPFRITIAQMLWLAALCALASGFVARAIRSSEARDPVNLVFSPDGRLLAANFMRGGILVWDVSGQRPRRMASPVDTGRKRAFASPGWVAHFQFAGPDTIAYAPWEPSAGRLRLMLWDVRRKQSAGTIFLSGGNTVAVSPDARLAAEESLPGGQIAVIDVKTGRLVRSIAIVEFSGELAFSDDGKRLIVVEQTVAEVFRLEDGQRESIVTIPLHLDARVSPDGRCFALVDHQFPGNKSTLHIVRADGKDGFKVEGRFLASVRFLPDSRQVAVDTVDGVEIWDIPSRKRIRTVDTPPSFPQGFAVSPDGRTLAIAEPDRISLWDAQTGKHLGDVWARHAFLEAAIFSLGFIAWAVVWGLMRRQKHVDARPEENPLHSTLLHAGHKPGRRTVRFSFVGAAVLLVIVGGAFALPWAFAAAQASGGATSTGLLSGLGVLLLGPLALILIVVIVLLFKKQVFRSHAAELRRAAAIAQSPCRTAGFGPITAYFFGGSTLDAHFAQDLATVRSRLGELLGEVAQPPHLPVFCFERQEQFDEYFGRRLPLGGVYSPPWWARQIVICERPACGVADPRAVLRTLLSFALLWNHKGFRVPWWMTTVVNAHTTCGDDDAHLARVHRRLKAELERRGELTPLPHTLDVKQFTRLVLARDQRDAFFTQSLLGDVCASLAAYLMRDGDRRREFGELLRGLSKRSDLDDAFRQHFGRSVDELMADWLAWLREQIADPMLDRHTAPPEAVRRQIVEDVAPLLVDPAADLDARCRAARSLGDAGWLLGAGALIEVLAQSRQGQPREGETREGEAPAEPASGNRPVREGEAPAEPGSGNRPVREAELARDARWALESISGRRLGDDAGAWRSWLHEAAATAAQPPVDATVLPEDEIVDAAAVNAAPADSAPIDAVLADAASNNDVAQPASRLLLVAPRWLVTCWASMVLGGSAAVFLAAFMLLEIGLVWWPMFYYGVALGVFTITRGVGRRTRRLRTVGLLQILNLLNFDPINPLFGIVLLIVCRTPAVRAYLAAQNSSK